MICYSGCLIITQESASEWNSLLITARAERGPQWDVGTQQYVDLNSITDHWYKLILQVSGRPGLRLVLRCNSPSRGSTAGTRRRTTL